MPVIVGVPQPPILAPTDYDGFAVVLTDALGELDFEKQEGSTRVNYDLGVDTSPRTDNAPVEQREATLAGRRLPSFFNDYYNRIHTRPQNIELGSVVSTQVTQVYVWNAYLVNRTLNSVTGETEGLDLVGQPAPPLLYPPLNEKVYQLTVSPDGPPVIDDILQWTFDNGDYAQLLVSGIRISPWWVRADWSDPVVERLEWLTSISRTPYGVEQRRSNRIAPRRTFRLKSIANRKQRRYLELSIAESGGRNWAIPLWPQTQFLPYTLNAGSLSVNVDTTYFEYVVGGMLMIGGDNPWECEVLEIKTVSPTGVTLVRPTVSNWPAGSRVVPGRIAVLKEQPMMHRLTDEAVSIEVYFEQAEVADYASAMPAQTYLGKPVYWEVPEESEDLTNQAQRLLTMIQSNTALPRQIDTATHSFKAQGHRWQVYGRKAISDLRSFLYALGGRWKSVWVPTHYNDLQLVEPMEATAAYMDVEWSGYTKTGAKNNAGTRDIQILLKNGTRLYRRITQAEELGSGLERLQLNSSLGVAVSTANLDRISFMNIMRLDQDFVELNHVTDSTKGMVSSKVVWFSLRDDV